MTPEQQAQLQQIFEWMQIRQHQQIGYPLDEASRNSLGVGTARGPGSTALTQNITIGAGGGSAAVPKAYAGTLIIEFEGVRYEVPYLSTP